MITFPEILRALLAPALVAALIAGAGRWRRWAWAMPLAAGAGFLVGYLLLTGVPRLPPRDGTDWLFWAAIPVTLVGVVDALLARRWGWIFGAVAGGVALLIAWPLVPRGLSAAEAVVMGAGLAVIGAGICLLASVIEARDGAGASTAIAALCMTVAAAAIVVFASNLRIVGIYGMAAAAALGPVALLGGGELRAGRSVAMVAAALLAGLLAGGHYYADPGVGATQALLLLLLTPALLPVGLLVPDRRRRLRAPLTLLLIAGVLACIAVPTALRAWRASIEHSADGWPGP